MENKYYLGDISNGIKDSSRLSSYYRILSQSVRNLHITIEVLNAKGVPVDTIHGISTGGNISVSVESMIRRTGSLSLNYIPRLEPSPKSPLWMTNFLRVYAGIEDSASYKGEVTNFLLGEFYISEPSKDINNSGKSMSVEILDKMMKWEDIQLEKILKIDAETPLNTIVTSLLQLHGEWNYHVDFTDLIVPYTMEFEVGETMLDVFMKLRDLYMDWECYYTVDGKFVFRKMKIQQENAVPATWSFDNGEKDLRVSYKESFSYRSIRNRIIVNGQVSASTGATARAEIRMQNRESDFHEDVIGVKTMVINDPSYHNNEQCTSRAKYELFRNSTYQQKISITCVPIYILECNDVISIKSDIVDEYHKYVIDSIEIDLGVEGTMSIECHKLYFNSLENDMSMVEFERRKQVVIDGIENHKWILSAEKIIYDRYGIKGTGTELVLGFESDGLHGTTAYVTGFFSDTKQSLTVDLADFGDATGPEGNTGQGKGDFASRIIGHEMVHAVMNNYFGAKFTNDMPTWFKEGLGEFIHGADERLKNTIVLNGAVSEVAMTSLIKRAEELLSGSVWRHESRDYVASYILVKFIYELSISSGVSFERMFTSIKDSIDITGDVAESVRKGISIVSGISDFYMIISRFNKDGLSYLKNRVTIDVNKDEIDTGSIRGSDHGGSNLSAEQVMRHIGSDSNTSIGFKVVVPELVDSN